MIKVRLPGKGFPGGSKNWSLPDIMLQWVILRPIPSARRPVSPWFISQIGLDFQHEGPILSLSDRNNYNERAQPRKLNRNIPLFNRYGSSRGNVFSSKLVKFVRNDRRTRRKDNYRCFDAGRLLIACLLSLVHSQNVGIFRTDAV